MVALAELEMASNTVADGIKDEPMLAPVSAAADSVVFPHLCSYLHSWALSDTSKAPFFSLQV